MAHYLAPDEFHYDTKPAVMEGYLIPTEFPPQSESEFDFHEKPPEVQYSDLGRYRVYPVNPHTGTPVVHDFFAQNSPPVYPMPSSPRRAPPHSPRRTSPPSSPRHTSPRSSPRHPSPYSSPHHHSSRQHTPSPHHSPPRSGSPHSARTTSTVSHSKRSFSPSAFSRHLTGNELYLCNLRVEEGKELPRYAGVEYFGIEIQVGANTQATELTAAHRMEWHEEFSFELREAQWVGGVVLKVMGCSALAGTYTYTIATAQLDPQEFLPIGLSTRQIHRWLPLHPVMDGVTRRDLPGGYLLVTVDSHVVHEGSTTPIGGVLSSPMAQYLDSNLRLSRGNEWNVGVTVVGCSALEDNTSGGRWSFAEIKLGDVSYCTYKKSGTMPQFNEMFHFSSKRTHFIVEAMVHDPYKMHLSGIAHIPSEMFMPTELHSSHVEKVIPLTSAQGSDVGHIHLVFDVQLRKTRSGKHHKKSRKHHSDHHATHTPPSPHSPHSSPHSQSPSSPHHSTHPSTSPTPHMHSEDHESSIPLSHVHRPPHANNPQDVEVISSPHTHHTQHPSSHSHPPSIGHHTTATTTTPATIHSHHQTLPQQHGQPHSPPISPASTSHYFSGDPNSQPPPPPESTGMYIEPSHQQQQQYQHHHQQHPQHQQQHQHPQQHPQQHHQHQPQQPQHHHSPLQQHQPGTTYLVDPQYSQHPHHPQHTQQAHHPQQQSHAAYPNGATGYPQHTTTDHKQKKKKKEKGKTPMHDTNGSPYHPQPFIPTMTTHHSDNPSTSTSGHSSPPIPPFSPTSPPSMGGLPTHTPMYSNNMDHPSQYNHVAHTGGQSEPSSHSTPHSTQSSTGHSPPHTSPPPPLTQIPDTNPTPALPAHTPTFPQSKLTIHPTEQHLQQQPSPQHHIPPPPGVFTSGDSPPTGGNSSMYTTTTTTAGGGPSPTVSTVDSAESQQQLQPQTARDFPHSEDILIVTVLTAENMAAEDITSDNDTFVRLTVGANVYETTIFTGKTAEWFESFAIPIKLAENRVMKIDVFDADNFNNQLIGNCATYLYDLPFGEGVGAVRRDISIVDDVGSFAGTISLLFSGQMFEKGFMGLAPGYYQ